MTTTNIPDWAIWQVTVTLASAPGKSDTEYFENHIAAREALRGGIVYPSAYATVREAIRGGMVYLSAYATAKLMHRLPSKAGEYNEIDAEGVLVRITRVREG